jgi:hypothetical protein
VSAAGSRRKSKIVTSNLIRESIGKESAQQLGQMFAEVAISNNRVTSTNPSLKGSFINNEIASRMSENQHYEIDTVENIRHTQRPENDDFSQSLLFEKNMQETENMDALVNKITKMMNVRHSQHKKAQKKEQSLKTIQNLPQQVKRIFVKIRE